MSLETFLERSNVPLRWERSLYTDSWLQEVMDGGQGAGTAKMTVVFWDGNSDL